MRIECTQINRSKSLHLGNALTNSTKLFCLPFLGFNFQVQNKKISKFENWQQLKLMMNESFVESFVDDPKIRNYEKSKCSWSACGEYLAIAALNNDKTGTLIFYDNENRLIESAPNTSTDFLCKDLTKTSLMKSKRNKLIDF